MKVVGIFIVQKRKDPPSYKINKNIPNYKGNLKKNIFYAKLLRGQGVIL